MNPVFTFLKDVVSTEICAIKPCWVDVMSGSLGDTGTGRRNFRSNFGLVHVLMCIHLLELIPY